MNIAQNIVFHAENSKDAFKMAVKHPDAQSIVQYETDVSEVIFKDKSILSISGFNFNAMQG